MLLIVHHKSTSLCLIHCHLKAIKTERALHWMNLPCWEQLQHWVNKKCSSLCYCDFHDFHLSTVILHVVHSRLIHAPFTHGARWVGWSFHLPSYFHVDFLLMLPPEGTATRQQHFLSACSLTCCGPKHTALRFSFAPAQSLFAFVNVRCSCHTSESGINNKVTLVMSGFCTGDGCDWWNWWRTDLQKHRRTDHKTDGYIKCTVYHK